MHQNVHQNVSAVQRYLNLTRMGRGIRTDRSAALVKVDATPRRRNLHEFVFYPCGFRNLLSWNLVKIRKCHPRRRHACRARSRRLRR